VNRYTESGGIPLSVTVALNLSAYVASKSMFPFNIKSTPLTDNKVFSAIENERCCPTSESLAEKTPTLVPTGMFSLTSFPVKSRKETYKHRKLYHF